MPPSDIFQSYADSPPLLLLLIIIAVSSVIFLLTNFGAGGGGKLPPSPRSLPLIGHMHHLGPTLHRHLHTLSAQHGPLVHFHIGPKPCLLASTPDLAHEILKTNEPAFLNRPKVANLHYLTYGSADFATAQYGPYWKFMKHLLMNRLLGPQTLDRFAPVRRDETIRFLNRTRNRAEAGEEGMDVGAELTRLTNNVISRMMLRTRCSDDDAEADEVRRLVREMTELGRMFNVSDTFWVLKNWDLQGFEKRLVDARGRYDVLMERIMKEHEDLRRKRKMKDGDCGGLEDCKDVLDILLDIYEDEEAEMKLTRENIKAFIMNIFGAGTDTSSILIEWGLSELINHPDVTKKARQEMELVVGNDRLVQESDIPNLPYLQAILKELLRLHPTGPLIVRESSQECTIAGYKIPAKTRLFVNIWSLGRDPSHWKDPEEFSPERFMGTEWSGKKKNNMLDVRGQHFHLLPFGSGRRSCPGASLALRFVPATLAAMIQCFDWTAVGDGGGGGRVDMEEGGAGLTLSRARPLVCVPIARRGVGDLLSMM
ncbi:unnamed protein product [Linum tenue]|uniref:Uncharacterized protein n=1 Tax=Linum tenue TaxID=586396 RepID=A0AAV0JCX3_9ROSI|nr:unnamed protein product [Linum tenue]